MELTIYPRKLSGSLAAIPSKSQAHRYLICAAFSGSPTTLVCPQTNRDIEATAACLNALGAEINRTSQGYHIVPIEKVPDTALLPCGESGSTLRFLLPIAGALGVDATFQMEGRLPERPLAPLWEEMERMGCSLTRPTRSTIRCCGKLRAGDYTIDGGVSSQFVTGLCFALPLIGGAHTLQITGKLESRPYVDMTRRAQMLFGLPGAPSPGTVTVEGDWSNAAFFLAAQALGNSVEVTNLDPDSPQGDRAAAELISALKDNITIDATDIPDLVPILAVVAAANQGARFTGIRRLRLKESDRVASVVAMIEALGGSAAATEDTLTVRGTGFRGGTVDGCNDHRIVMAAAIAATACTEPVTIRDAEAVSKSYPIFWEEYRKLGGNYEQHLR